MVVGCQWWFAGCWLLVIWWLVGVLWLLIGGCVLLVVGCYMSVAVCLSRVVGWWVLVVR